MRGQWETKMVCLSYRLNWNPDRAHHSTEDERCVRYMGHFSPLSVQVPYIRSTESVWISFAMCGSLLSAGRKNPVAAAGTVIVRAPGYRAVSISQLC